MASNTERIVELEKRVRRQIDTLADVVAEVATLVDVVKGNFDGSDAAVRALVAAMKELREDIDDIEDSGDVNLEKRIASLEQAVLALPSPSEGRKKPLKAPNKNLVDAMKATMKRRAAKEKAAAAEQ